MTLEWTDILFYSVLIWEVYNTIRAYKQDVVSNYCGKYKVEYKVSYTSEYYWTVTKNVPY